MWCEFCANLVPFDDYEYLSENTVYDDEDVYIVHKDCEAQEGWKIVETYETCGELRIVRVESV